MSRITKMKYVAAETVYDYELPKADQSICKIRKPLGNNTHLVVSQTGEEFIVSMPPKFRRHVYVRRNGYVITEPIPEGVKVKAEIIRILQRNQIKHFKNEGVWPEVFNDTIYLDNSHKIIQESDRGFVHGTRILYGFITSTKLTASAEDRDSSDSCMDPSALGGVFKEASTASAAIRTTSYEDEEDELSEDDESDLIPNVNKKAITRFVYSEDELDDQTNADEVGDTDDESGDSSDESDDESGDSSDESDDKSDESTDTDEDSDESDDGSDDSDVDSRINGVEVSVPRRTYFNSNVIDINNKNRENPYLRNLKRLYRH